MTRQAPSTDTATSPDPKPKAWALRVGRTSAAAEPRTAPKKPAQKTPKTKGETLIAMLSSARGASIAALSKRLGWQPHTIRAAISRLRKAGHAIDRQASKAGPVYRIVAAAAAA
ncbi:MAG: DUF3489 domain-containing protein [Pseudomonadota bacterium]